MSVPVNGGSGVEGDGLPSPVDMLLVELVAAEEVARGVGSVNLEAGRAAVGGGEADVVEHGAGVEEFGVELEAAALACERGEVVDAAGVVEEQIGFGVADELGDLVGEFGVGNGDA